MSVNRVGNNIFIKPYEQNELKTYAQNNVDNPFFSTQTSIDTFQKTTQNYQENETIDTTSLRQDLEKTKSEQGIISKAWDGIKNFFGAKNSSSNVEKTIEKFENGEISEEEARQALDEYKNAQNTFSDKLSGIISTAGLIGTVTGAVLSFIPGGQVIGLPLLAISGKVALGGMFIDNALDLVDNSTDKDGLTKDELKDLAIETGVEAVSYMAGRGIGKLTGNIHTNVIGKLASNGSNKIAGNIAGYGLEALADGTLSLAADYGITQAQSLITTGKTVAWNDYWSWDRFTSEGRSQLIGILTGVATSKQYPTGAIAPAAAGTEVASKRVIEVDASVNKAHAVEVETNAPRRLMFNPETGELTPAKPRIEAKLEPLDHPVSGDNIGMRLRNNDGIGVVSKGVRTDASVNKPQISQDGKRVEVQNDATWRNALPEGQDYYRDAEGKINLADSETAKKQAVETDRPDRPNIKKTAQQKPEDAIKELDLELKTLEEEYSKIQHDNSKNEEFGRLLGPTKLTADEVASLREKIEKGNYTENDLKNYIKEKNPKITDEQVKNAYELIKSSSVEAENYLKIKGLDKKKKDLQSKKEKAEAQKARMQSELDKYLESREQEKRTGKPDKDEDGNIIYKSETRKNPDAGWKYAGEEVKVPKPLFDELEQYIRINGYDRFIAVTNKHAMHRLFGRYAKTEKRVVTDITGATKEYRVVTDITGATKFLDKINKYIDSDSIYHSDYSSEYDAQIGFLLSKGECSRGGISLLIKNGDRYDNVILNPTTGKITTVIADVTEASASKKFYPILRMNSN